MKNYKTKDGVSDADLIPAARDLYEALQDVTADLVHQIKQSRQLQYKPYDAEDLDSVIAARNALAKARGQS